MPLLDGDMGLGNDPVPFGRFLIQEPGEGLRVHERQFHARRHQLVAPVGLGHAGDDGLVERVEHRLGGAGRRQDAVPVTRLVARDPASAIVGTSGRILLRSLLEIASGTSVPCLAWGMMSLIVVITRGTSPLMAATVAGAPPL